MKSHLLLAPAVAALVFVFPTAESFGADEDVGTIERRQDFFPPPIPVSISGFSGEVDAVFKNDIIFLGMKNVPPAEAKYLITGSNSGDRVEGRLVRKVDNAQIFAHGYTGGIRLSTHTLADGM